ncbi:MAG: biopolymer transporter ExbD [Planctomycetota bacterium]|nr:biopolymer transporter ExbD [Planctomycetota bacterium]
MTSPMSDHQRRRESSTPPIEVIEPTRVRRRHRRSRARIGLNVTAMIDIVFLLLIYFLAATEFKLGEEVYRLDLPQRGLAADPFELPRDPLRVVIATTGPGEGGYTIRIRGPYTQPGSFQELYEFLHHNRGAETAVGGLFEQDHPIIIEPAIATRWEHAIDAYNAAARARYTNITFAPPR